MSILTEAFMVTSAGCILVAWTPWPTLSVGILLALLVAPSVMATHKGWFETLQDESEPEPEPSRIQSP